MLFKRTLVILVVLAFTVSVSSMAAAKTEAPILGADSSTASPGR